MEAATGSSKQLKNKTVGGDTEFTNIFETWMDEVAAASDGSGAGSAGVAGVVLSTTNPAKQYLQSAQGQEWTQLIEKIDDFQEISVQSTVLCRVSVFH